MIKLYFPILTLGFLTLSCFEVQAQVSLEDACRNGFNVCMDVCTKKLNLDVKNQCEPICIPSQLKCNGKMDESSSPF